jgi:hypothetical protein
MSDDPPRKHYELSLAVNAFDVFTGLGYRFSLDFDDEVLVEQPEELDRSKLNELIEQSMWQIQCRLKSKQRKQLSVFVGGPLAGKTHKGSSRLDGKMFVKLGPKRWAVYQHAMQPVAGVGQAVGDDPRLYFRGTSTSERNAREGRYIEAKR